jgi:lipoprotein-anchoring transpeptidase ErfK/SrfK
MKYLLFILALFSAPAYARGDGDNHILPAGRYQWTYAQDVTGPMSVKVNLRTQMAFVYAGDILVGESSVSTGRDHYETETGHFTVQGKEANHFSKKYKAPMPYTMWFDAAQGVALHAGGDPGVRSSHGCVHLPLSFAQQLYKVLKVGDRVVIVDEDPDFTVVL